MNNHKRLRIQEALRSDAELLVEFIKELAEYERLSSAVRVTPAMIEAALFGARPAAEAILAYDGEEPVGFAVFFTNFSTFEGKQGLYLEDLFVRPHARRRGIGRAMLSHLAGICRKRGYVRFEWAVLNWNSLAIEFYKSLGAIRLDDWTVFRLKGEPLKRLAVGGT